MDAAASGLLRHFPPPRYGTASPAKSLSPAVTSRSLGGAPVSPPRPSPREALAPFFAEMIGTFFLVFSCGCMGVRSGSVRSAGGLGLGVMVLAHTFGPLSGAHFNPAVSLAAMLAGKLRLLHGLGYIACQMLAALLAGLAYTAVLHKSLVLGTKSQFSAAEAYVLEILYTSLVCLVYLRMAPLANSSDDRDVQGFGIAVGLAVAAAGAATASVSAWPVLNPAVALGVGLSSYDQSFNWGVQYAGSELLGAVLAALIHFACGSRTNSPPLLRRLFAEFFGTFLVALSAGLCMLDTTTSVPWAYAAAVGCLTYALESTSGAHFNAAITLAVNLTGRRKLRWETLGYVAAQLLGSAVAGRFLMLLRPSAAVGLLPRGQYSWPSALICELAFTALLVMFILSVSTPARSAAGPTQHYLLGAGAASAVAVAGISVGPVSGAVLNPSVAAALALGFGDPTGLGFVTYALFQVAGGLIAVIAFMLTHPEEFPINWKFVKM